MFLSRLTMVSADAWNNSARLNGSPTWSGRSRFERGEPDRITLVDSELDVHVSALTAYQRVHHGVHVAALAVQQQQSYDIATELELVEVPLFPEPWDPPEIPFGRERAGIGGRDRGAQGVVVERVIALEVKPADHPLLLLLRGEGGRREYGDEQGQTERAHLTQSGCIPMLATSPRTVNLFDT